MPRSHKAVRAASAAVAAAEPVTPKKWRQPPLLSWRFERVERWTPGHHNPHDNLAVVTNKGERFELSSGHGSGDEVMVLRDGGREGVFYVVSIRRNLGYAGIAEYLVSGAKETPELKGDESPSPDVPPTVVEVAKEAFVDRDYDVEATFGKKGLDRDSRVIARLLVELLSNLGD